MHRQRNCEDETGDAGPSIDATFSQYYFEERLRDVHVSVTCVVVMFALAMNGTHFVAIIIILVLHVGAHRCFVV